MYVLGLACATSQHHGAALLRDGEIMGAVAEERFTRVKGYGWHPPGRPGANLVNAPSIRLRDAWPRHSVNWLLAKAGIGLDDVDVFAVNGIPARYAGTYSAQERSRPPQIIDEGRTTFVPHHLAHAAGAFRLSGFESALVVTVDGRGERETACSFEARGGVLRRGREVLVGEGGSIGGAYETLTRILGFGPFGQGSTMALAPFGKPAHDLRGLFELPSHSSPHIDEYRLGELFSGLSRSPQGPLSDAHCDLAASAQQALERCVSSFVAENLSAEAPAPLCLAGGVALNCAMNSRLARLPGVAGMFVDPASHDAGTALGAALEAAHHRGAPLPARRLRSAALGPSYENEACLRACAGAGVQARRIDDIATEVAERLANGQVVAWFQGALEVGPRALGSARCSRTRGAPTCRSASMR